MQRRMICVFLAAGFFLLSAISVLASPTTGPTLSSVSHPWIIDTDMSWDDWMALTYFVKQPINIEAISVDGDGAADCTSTSKIAAYNVLKLLRLAQHSYVPVACGSSVSLSPNSLPYPSWFRQKMDTMYGINLPASPYQPSKATAVQMLYNIILHSTKNVNVLAIGTMTTLAQLFRQHPNIKSHINAIYFMGGAIHVYGNMSGLYPNTANKYAEMNIYSDPVAADYVFRSGVSIYLFPLDLTNSVPILYEDYQHYQAKHGTAIASFLWQILGNLIIPIMKNHIFYWDPSAAVVALTPSLIQTIKIDRLTVNLTPGNHYAQLTESPNGSPVRVIEGINVTKFRQILFDNLALNLSHH